ncbi:MAG TPA: DNA repair protein RadA [Firmicutes bacterium]|jgi:DNA repair protein RadA/Sms|nr:DNA repair protein RadA [Bacillota bacterium]
MPSIEKGAKMGKGILFSCQNCGYESPKWLGRCPSCSEWNSFQQIKEEKQTSGAEQFKLKSASVPLNFQPLEHSSEQRLLIGRPELDRLFGGGLVPGSLILLGGEPGAGKSTLLLQIASQLAEEFGKALYVSAEESLSQIKLRAERLGLVSSELFILQEDEIETVLAEAERIKPVAVVIDSVQTLKRANNPSFPGSPAQIREVVQAVMGLAKGRGMICFLVGHITKSGLLAGPKLIEHMVDVVLYFEGDRRFPYRVLRVAKNRFGSTQEIALLSLGEKGLTPVQNPSAFLLSERRPDQSGTVVTPIVEGSLPLLVEIQALVTAGNPGNPRRLVSGLDNQRVAMVLAVLERRGGLPLSSREVYVSVIGGIRTEEPACDLAVALAVASSFYDLPLPQNLAAFGEIGLTGEVRRVGGGQRRLEEAKNHGFHQLLLPKGLLEEVEVGTEMRVQGIDSIQEMLASLTKKEGV